MSFGAGWVAAVSLVPAMIGPFASSDQSAAMIALCGGGAITLPVNSGPSPAEGNAPCCAKGCHASRSRKSVDRAQ